MSAPWLKQHLGGVGFLAGIVPGIGPDDLHLEVRIDRLRAQHEGVDAGDDFRDREGHDVARRAGLRHLGRDLADHVAALVELGIVGRHVFGSLVAGGVLELHVRKLGGNLQRRLHEAEGGREDDVAAVTGEALDGALGVGFRNVLDIGCLDLVAQFLLDREAALIVLVGPAEVADRADIDPAGLGLGLGVGTGRRHAQRHGEGGGGHHEFLHSTTPCLFLVQRSGTKG